jgi:hypothetical protein
MDIARSAFIWDESNPNKQVSYYDSRSRNTNQAADVLASHLSGVRKVFTGLGFVDFYIPQHNLCVMIDDHQEFYGAGNHRL